MRKTVVTPKRRKRTTKIFVVVETTIKDLAKVLKVNEGTLGSRYHRIKDRHPKSAVMVSALVVSHKRKEIKDLL